MKEVAVALAVAAVVSLLARRVYAVDVLSAAQNGAADAVELLMKAGTAINVRK